MSELRLSLLIIIFLATGCTIPAADKAVKVSTIRKKPAFAQQVKKVLVRDEYQLLLAEGGETNKVRLVEVYSSDRAAGLIKYRFFGVRTGGVFEYLGLKDADVLVSIEGYVVSNQALLWQYLNLLGRLPKGEIEIERNGVAMTLSYSFTDVSAEDFN